MKKRTFTVVATLAATILPVAVAAQWTGPSGSPPNNNPSGPVWLQGASPSQQTGSFYISGDARVASDIYFTSDAKAIRVDGVGSRSLNIGNWGAGISPNTGLSMYLYGHLTMLPGYNSSTPPILTMQGLSRLNVYQICLTGDTCRTTWPTGGASDIWVDTVGDTMTGRLRIGSGSTPITGHALGATGTVYAARLANSTAGNLATIGGPNYGIAATGTTFGAYFEDADSSGYAHLGFGNYGVQGRGDTTGVYGEDTNDGSSGRLGYGDYGAYGDGTYGLYGLGVTAGAQGQDTDTDSYGRLGYGNYGAYGMGATVGVHGESVETGSWGRLGSSSYGVRGVGSYGVFGEGTSAGVRGDVTGVGAAVLGFADAGYGGDFNATNGTGVHGAGAIAGGYFVDGDGGSGYAYVGYGDYGVQGRGNNTGVYGQDLQTSNYGRLGYGNYGVYGVGAIGVYGADASANSSGRLGTGSIGVEGVGPQSGVSGSDSDTGSYGNLGFDNMGVYANGTSYGFYTPDLENYFGGTRLGDVGCSSGYRGIQMNGLSQNCTNYAVLQNSGDTFVNAPTGGSVWMRVNNANSAEFRGSGVYAYKTGGGSWGTISDIRLKDVEGTYDRGLSDIMKLDPIRYHFKEGNAKGIEDTKTHYVGFSAQDVEKVIPEAVEYDADGYRTLNADPIYWTMLNAIKELKTENDSLKARVEALEAK